jgi:hypothetical protein
MLNFETDLGNDSDSPRNSLSDAFCIRILPMKNDKKTLQKIKIIVFQVLESVVEPVFRHHHLKQRKMRGRCTFYDLPMTSYEHYKKRKNEQNLSKKPEKQLTCSFL